MTPPTQEQYDRALRASAVSETKLAWLASGPAPTLQAKLDKANAMAAEIQRSTLEVVAILTTAADPTDCPACRESKSIRTDGRGTWLCVACGWSS